MNSTPGFAIICTAFHDNVDIAKIAGIKLCESYNRQYGASHGVDYRSVMPTNLYGPGDNYHPENSHVIPALIRRFHEAKLSGAPEVAIWGSGTPMREFLYVDDMAAASVHVMNLPKARYEQHTQPMLSHINVGCGEDVTILEMAQAVARTVGYTGPIHTDPTKPDGTPRKLMDVSRLAALGFDDIRVARIEPVPGGPLRDWLAAPNARVSAARVTLSSRDRNTASGVFRLWARSASVLRWRSRFSRSVSMKALMLSVSGSSSRGWRSVMPDSSPRCTRLSSKITRCSGRRLQRSTSICSSNRTTPAPPRYHQSQPRNTNETATQTRDQTAASLIETRCAPCLLIAKKSTSSATRRSATTSGPLRVEASSPG